MFKVLNKHIEKENFRPVSDHTIRYRGIVDRYEQLNDDGGRGGYHVAYDDGDEEMLGEIDGRSDVRLLDSPRGDDDVTPLEVRVSPFSYITFSAAINDTVLTSLCSPTIPR